MNGPTDLGFWLRPRNAAIFRYDVVRGFRAFRLLEIQEFKNGPDRVTLTTTDSETHTHAYTTARNPIEPGAVLSKITNPQTVTITGTFHTHPIITLPVGEAVLRLSTMLGVDPFASVPPIPGGFGVPGKLAQLLPNKTATGYRTDLQAFQQLLEIANGDDLVTVVTPHATIPRATIDNITRSHEPGLDGGMRVSITATAAVVVSGGLADREFDIDAIQTGNPDDLYTGRQTAEPVEDPFS